MSRPAKGFTLLELVIAMTVMALITVALYGVIALGASAAGAGERRTEQARRFRTAVTVMARQLRSVAPMYISEKKDEDPQPFFLAEDSSIAFVTAAPQGPNAAGFAIVRYWVEDGNLMMSELPYFLAFDEDGLDKDAKALTLETVLLYDVKSFNLAFQRSGSEKDKWEDGWDAAQDDQLPAVVRIAVEPETPDGPQFEYQVPVYVGVLNAITGEDDFQQRHQRAARASFSTAGAQNARGRKGATKAKQPPPQPDDDSDDGGDDF
jgi:general secretion pathway protein J